MEIAYLWWLKSYIIPCDSVSVPKPFIKLPQLGPEVKADFGKILEFYLASPPAPSSNPTQEDPESIFSRSRGNANLATAAISISIQWTLATSVVYGKIKKKKKTLNIKFPIPISVHFHKFMLQKGSCQKSNHCHITLNIYMHAQTIFIIFLQYSFYIYTIYVCIRVHV